MQSNLAIVIALVLVIPALCLFPTPKFASLGQKLTLGSPKMCGNFQIQYSGPEVAGVMPSAQGSQLESSPGAYYFDKVMRRVQGVSGCQPNNFFVKNKIHQINLKLDRELSPEGYRINSTSSHVDIEFSTYSGYVYALETLEQMIEGGNTIQLGLVEDEPIVSYRGIMIDPVRHFIGVSYIRRLIEAMPLSKLNMLHWSFSNDEAFVVELVNHPELAEAGRYSPEESYTVAQVRELIALAKVNAVSIIPEFDTPGHVRSWGLAKPWADKNITILCPGGEHYNHQFDLSKDDTYRLTQDVLKEADLLFKDSPFIHLGGDEVFGSCWDLRPAIKTFMALKNIKNYGQLQMYWRYQIKQALPSSRKTIFWRNNADNLTTGAEDVVQYWGAQADTAKFATKSESKYILSPSDYLYLNKGTTWIWMNKTNGDFVSWKQIYLNFDVQPQGVDPSRILGAEVCLWNEVQNEDTFENEIWMRASSFAAKVWRNQVGPLAPLVRDLVALQKKLISMGNQPSPIVNQFCQIYPDTCFPASGHEGVNSELPKKGEQIIQIE